MTLFASFAGGTSWGRRLLLILAFFAAGLLTPTTRADCLISGPDVVCTGVTNIYVASPSFTNSNLSYSWAVTNISTNAVFIYGTNLASVEFISMDAGTFALQCTITEGTNSETCVTNITVASRTSSSPLADQTACPLSTVTFTTVPFTSGSPLYTHVRRKSGTTIPGATTNSLTLSEISDADAGTYCVEIYGACDYVTNCAMLAVV